MIPFPIVNKENEVGMTAAIYGEMKFFIGPKHQTDLDLEYFDFD